jgi:iron complex outermembrane receptor protein
VATVDIGIRLDNHSKTGSQWIPQVGLSFHLPKNIETKTIVGKGFRNPTIRELFMFTPQNPNLLPEEVMNYELSLSQNIVEKNLFYDVAVFYLEGKNMIQTVISNGRPINVNTGKIKNFGFESVINYRINTFWSANVNYSWSI